MQEFAAKHSPGLWETLLKALTGDRGALTSERADLQKRRIVALLHILAYFVNNNNKYYCNNIKRIIKLFLHFNNTVMLFLFLDHRKQVIFRKQVDCMHQ